MLSSFFLLFKPAAHRPILQDSQKIQKLYAYWRCRIFYSIYVGYVFYYFTRKSLTFAMPALMDEMGYSPGALGFLGTSLYLVYGVSKFLSGIWADRSSPRYFMSVGLILTGVINILFGCASSLLAFACLWGLNGFFQGWGWPPCTKQLTHWFGKQERGLWWGIKSTSHNVGGALIPLLAAACISWTGSWRFAMYIPGVLSLLAGFWLMERLRDEPPSLGLPPVEAYKGSKQVKDYGDLVPSSPLSSRDILFTHVLSKWAVWILGVAYFFIYVVRTALNDWAVLYLVRSKGYSMLTASGSIFWFEVGGFLGVLSAGWGSDRIFRGQRVPLMMISSFLLFLGLGFFWSYSGNSVFLDYLLIGFLGFLIFGPQVLVGLAAAEFVDKKAACSANGFVGCFAYLGAAATGYPLGKLLEYWGWDGVFAALMLCSLLTIMTLFLLLLSGGARVQEA